MSEIPKSWYKKIYYGTILVSLFLIFIFVWQRYITKTPFINIPLTVGISNVAVLFFAIIFNLMTFKSLKVKKASITLVYLALEASIIYLVYKTGLIKSPFLPLFAITFSVSGIIGVIAFIPIAAIAVLYLVLLFLDSSISSDLLIQATINIGMPIFFASTMFVSNNYQEDSLISADPNAQNVLSSKGRKISSDASTIVNSITDGVIAIDKDGIIKLINPAAQAIVGWTNQDDAVGLNYQSVLHVADRDGSDFSEDNNPVNNNIHFNKEFKSNNLTIITKSNKMLLASITVTPIANSSDMIIVFRDITKDKKEERQQAEFISTASHEMRTPIASIEGYINLILNPNIAKIDDRAKEYLVKAHEATRHLGRLFQDLLDISKTEDGRMKSSPQLIDLGDFVSRIVDHFVDKANSRGLELVNELKEGKTLHPLYQVYVDPDHLTEVISNLIENAIKYTPKGSVEVGLISKSNRVIITVKDNGIGIPAEDIPHLFQKFYRVNNSATREVGGTGLGLYLCRRLVESMNGTIYAESVFKKGSIFFVDLPRLSKEEVERLELASSILVDHSKDSKEQLNEDYLNTLARVSEADRLAASHIKEENESTPVNAAKNLTSETITLSPEKLSALKASFKKAAVEAQKTHDTKNQEITEENSDSIDTTENTTKYKEQEKEEKSPPNTTPSTNAVDPNTYLNMEIKIDNPLNKEQYFKYLDKLEKLPQISPEILQTLKNKLKNTQLQALERQKASLAIKQQQIDTLKRRQEDAKRIQQEKMIEISKGKKSTT